MKLGKSVEKFTRMVGVLMAIFLPVEFNADSLKTDKKSLLLIVVGIPIGVALLFGLAMGIIAVLRIH